MAISALKKPAPVILELGWSDTSSLAVWSTYYPSSKVVGSFPAAPPASPTPQRYQVEVGEPTDAKYLAALIAKYDPDVFIDDASHRWKQQKLTLSTVLPLLKPGSVYVIEDLQTSYVEPETFGDGLDRRQSTAEYLRDLMIGLLSGGASNADGADAFQRMAPRLIASVRVGEKICFISRNDRVARTLTVAPSLAGKQTASSNGGPYFRINAFIEGQTPDNKRQFEEKTRTKEVVPPAGLVTELRDATVYGRGVIVNPEDQLLKPSLINVYGDQEEFETLFRPKGSDKITAFADSGRTRTFGSKPVVLLKQRWDRNYGHWLIESLPRLALVQNAYDLADCLFMVGEADAAMARIYRESLELGGIGPEQILVTDDKPCRIERLVYPHPLTVQPWVKAPLAVSFLEKMRDGLGPGTKASADRIIVVRSEKSRRRLLNQERITAIAKRYQFEAVSIEHMSLRQQISAFRDANFIVGSLGAELTNMCFSPRGASLLGLSPAAMQDDFYYDLTCLKGGRYFSLHGSAAGGSGALESDFTIDETRFESILRLMLKM